MLGIHKQNNIVFMFLSFMKQNWSNFPYFTLIQVIYFTLFTIEMHSMEYLSVKLNAKFVPTLAKCFPFE